MNTYMDVYINGHPLHLNVIINSCTNYDINVPKHFLQKVHIATILIKIHVHIYRVSQKKCPVFSTFSQKTLGHEIEN